MRFAALVLTMLAMASGADAKDVITISKFTPFAEDSGATDAVKEECKFEERVPKYLQSEAKKIADIVLTDEPLDGVEGKVLYMEITHVFAQGGGGWSGGKNVEVEGELRENGEVIASFTVDRTAIFGMTPGTCSMLKRVAKKIGEDLAEWLEAPEMNSMLGDAAAD